MNGRYKSTLPTYANDELVPELLTDVNGKLIISGDLTIAGLPAAATLSDNTANPTTTGFAAYGMVYDGPTWDRTPGDSTNGIKVQPATGGEGAVSATTTRTVHSLVSKTFTDSTATATTSSGTMLASNASRKLGTTIVNTSDSISVSLNVTDAAVVNQGFTLKPGGTFYMDENSFTTGAITGITSTGTAVLSIMEAS